MQFTIPANTPDYKYGKTAFPLFCQWLAANGVDPAYVDGTQLLTVTNALISGTQRGFGVPFQVEVTVPMPKELEGQMVNLFFTDTSTTDDEAASLDDMAQWVSQLAKARKAAAEAKKMADEARDQILGRLKQLNKPYGAISGQRVVFAKSVPKSYFNKAACAADNPGLVEKYTEERPETRLEIL